MTRFDDLGLAGYERGTGYRPTPAYRAEPWTMRRALRVFAWIVVALGGSWLLWDAFGERIARLAMWLAMAATWTWRGWGELRNPLAGDEYATDEERRAVRRNGVGSLLAAAIWAIGGVALYLQSGGHGR